MINHLCEVFKHNMSLDTDENFETDENLQFVTTYKCYPLVNKDQKSIERGGNILLPLSTLEDLNNFDVPHPYTFKIKNESNQRFTHVGVLEFTAREGETNVPSWLMKALGLKNGNKVTLEAVSLPKGTYCKLEPLTRNFAYISDIIKVLERNLKFHYSCLTEGDILFLFESQNHQIYKVKIAELKPRNAVNIFDCEMDLEVAMPEKNTKLTQETQEKRKPQTVVFKAFQGSGYRCDGNGTANEGHSSKSEVHKQTNDFKPFQGIGRTVKRKSTAKDKNEPPCKKKTTEEETNDVNNLILIRQRQKDFVRKQSQESQSEVFKGDGKSLKDD